MKEGYVVLLEIKGLHFQLLMLKQTVFCVCVCVCVFVLNKKLGNVVFAAILKSILNCEVLFWVVVLCLCLFFFFFYKNEQSNLTPRLITFLFHSFFLVFLVTWKN